MKNLISSQPGCEYLKFHHFGLISSDAVATCKILADLGYEVSGPVDDPLQNVRAFWAVHSALPCVEVLSPTDTPGPVSSLAKKIKQGVYHLCFEVDDVAACLAKLSTHNQVVQVSEAKKAILFQNRRISFYYVENFGLIELLECD